VTQTRDLKVDDRPERRIRKPVDALRCLVSCAWIIVLAVAAVAASAATEGVETDLAKASGHLSHLLLVVAPPIALFALQILPVALAVTTLVRRQVQRVVEAVATGLLAGAAAEVANIVLRRRAFDTLYYAVLMAHPSTSHVDVLDPYLTGLVAFLTMIGLAGRPAWRNAFGLAIVVYAIVQLAALRTIGLSLLITLLAGRAIGFAVRYGAGSASQRPSARDIAAALAAEDLAPSAITQLPQPRASAPGAAGSRLYAVTTQDSGELDVVVFDRDQQAAGAFYRLYRWVRVRGQVARTAPLSFDRSVERRALLSYAARDAGVPTPQLRSLVRVGPEAAVLAFDHREGVTLARRNPGCSDEELSRVWDAVTTMHAHHVTHRGLTADRILFTPDGQVELLDPGDGDVAASDLQIRLDLVQLIVELALYAGPEASARLATRKLSGSELAALVPLLQPVVLVRSTRHAVRRRRDLLPDLRKRLLAAEPARDVAPVRLERIPPRTLVTLIASAAAVYLLAGELAKASLGSILKSADWRWGAVALGLSAVTYVGAALSVSGWVSERLSFVRTLLVQLASSFVTLVTPAAVGGVALNIRYLQRRKIPAPVAVASVGVSQVVAFVLHILMLITFAAIAGTGGGSPIRPPAWAYFVVLGLVVVAGAVLAVPAGRRTVQARLSPTFSQVLPRLSDVAQRPRKLAEGFGGALLLSAAYILCLAACVAAFGHSVPFAKIGVVYLTGSAIGSIIPTPGGLGAVEAALTAGLTAAGVPGGVAVSAVLLFRLLTFWLPVPVGWAAFSYLERHNDL
jgi:glycosyltransferase 2 family protein